MSETRPTFLQTWRTHRGIPDGEFDLAISYITLVDVVDMNAAISESFRVLRPGGRFLVCNVHPMRMASLGWIKRGDVKLHYPVDNYFDESARELASRDGHQWTSRSGLVCLNSAARFDKWNHAAVR